MQADQQILVCLMMRGSLRSAGLTPAGVRRKWIACSATRGFVNSAGRLIALLVQVSKIVHVAGEVTSPVVDPTSLVRGGSVVCAELVLSVTGNRRPRELQVCSVGVTPIDHT